MKAEDDYYVPQYCEDSDCFSATIYIQEKSPDGSYTSYLTYGSNKWYIMNLFSNSSPQDINNNYLFSADSGVKNAYIWYSEIGGHPPYLHVIYFNGEYYAYLSDKKEIKGVYKTLKYKEEKTSKDENEEEKTDDIEIYDYEGKVYNRDFKGTLTINNTKKTISITNATLEFEYKKLGSDSKLLFCNEQGYIYVYFNKETACKNLNIDDEDCSFDKDLYNCVELSSKESKSQVLQDGCPAYNSIKSKYPTLTTTVEKRNYANELKQYCNSALGYLNYNTIEGSCFQKCLHINKEINGILENDDTLEDGNCGLSGNLIKWIKNILKWIKYILPVMVIILGIIDFIKAISSGSDDEMKKAQGRFIKRLIAAALLFLIPALIEFILDVFNIESTLCGLTD